MQLELRNNGLFRIQDGEERKISDPICVLFRVRSDDEFGVVACCASGSIWMAIPSRRYF